MSSSPKVSIIIPCFNQCKYIGEAITSALNQTYANVEIVVINDASTDDSKSIIENFAQKYKNIVFLNNEENKGVVYSRNTAIDAACGEYILPLDGDDKIEPTYVEKAVKILQNNPKIGIVYCKAKLFGNKCGEWKLPEFSETEILYQNCVFCCSLFRKSDFEKVGKYKEYMNNGHEDWDLWLSFLEAGLKVHKIDEFLFNYRQLSSNTRTDMTWEIAKNTRLELLKNHMSLYTKSESFVDKVFCSPLTKIKKYKKLFFILLYISILEFIFILVIILNNYARGLING